MRNSRTVRVRVPASSANIGPGFDVLGLALGLYLTCTVREASQGSLKITACGADRDEIPCDESNLILQAFRRLAGDQTVELEIQNEIPLGRGLGSSAAAIVAGLTLANEWAGLKMTKEQIIEAATEMEGHPDNVAAAVLGGMVLSCQLEDGSIASLPSPFPSDIGIVLVIPEFQLSTEKARAALPETYSRRDAIFNLQRVGLLLASLRDGRFELLKEAMRDRLHQPYRAPLIPGLQEALQLNGIPGLLGVALSGAGPSILAFCKGNPQPAEESIVNCFRKNGIRAAARALAVDQRGVFVEHV